MCHLGWTGCDGARPAPDMRINSPHRQAQFWYPAPPRHQLPARCWQDQLPAIDHPSEGGAWKPCCVKVRREGGQGRPPACESSALASCLQPSHHTQWALSQAPPLKTVTCLQERHKSAPVLTCWALTCVTSCAERCAERLPGRPHAPVPRALGWS